MNIYGYIAQRSDDDIAPQRLAEITLCATPAELCVMAEFLSACASEMERMGSGYSHVHLSDRAPGFSGSPQFVVAAPDQD